MCVFVGIDPLHRMDLAACFGELTHFFICQNNTCIEVHPLVPFGASRLSEGCLHIGRAGWEVKVSFTVLLQHFLPIAFCAYQPSSLEEFHSSDVRNAPYGKDMRHLEAFQLPSLQFWLASKSVRAVLVFRQMISMNSHVTNRLQVTMPVTLLLFRPSESSFVSLPSPCVSALTFRRLAHLHPRPQRQFVISNCRVVEWSAFIDDAERLLQAMKNFQFACKEKPIILLTRMDVNDPTATHTGTRSQITQHVSDCVSPKLILSFSKPINPEPTLHCSPCLPARPSLQYETVSPTW